MKLCNVLSYEYLTSRKKLQLEIDRGRGEEGQTREVGVGGMWFCTLFYTLLTEMLGVALKLVQQAVSIFLYYFLCGN